MSRLRAKLLLTLIVVVIPFCFFVTVVTYTLSLGYQHDTDPEAFKDTLESLGVIQVSHFQIPRESDQPLPPGNGEIVMGKISHYWPPLGGPNCSYFVNGQCLARMASGEPWQEWVDQAVACPKKYEFGTRFVIQGKTWTCMDRGGAIVSFLKDIHGNLTNVVWLDQLTQTATVPFGTEIPVQVFPPDADPPPPHSPNPNPPVDISITTSGYLAVVGQNPLQKLVFGYLRLVGLVSDDLLAFEVGVDLDPSDPNNPDPTNPVPVTPPAGCNPDTPCVFPIQGGLSSIVVGTSANGGLSCHTSGGPQTIMGWDYWTPDKSEGAILYAAMDGFVDWAGTDGIGNPVIQISNSRYLLTYMHMKSVFVRSGQKVSQGEAIGTLGDVGNSAWAHLHYSIFEKGVGPHCNQLSFFSGQP